MTDYLEFDLLEYHSCKRTKCVYCCRGCSVYRASTAVKKYHAPKTARMWWIL